MGETLLCASTNVSITIGIWLAEFWFRKLSELLYKFCHFLMFIWIYHFSGLT
jgi:hypothetical protein